jgi:hypothetical protein
MASGRDKNSAGNYYLEQFSLNKEHKYKVNPEYSVAEKTCFPGNGLLTGRYCNDLLCNNGTDVESYLFGIGANNLVKPQPKMVAKIKKLDQISLFETRPIILPKTWEPEKGQRLRLLQ